MSFTATGASASAANLALSASGALSIHGASASTGKADFSSSTGALLIHGAAASSAGFNLISGTPANALQLTGVSISSAIVTGSTSINAAFVTKLLWANIQSPQLLPQAPVGSVLGFNSQVKNSGVLPVATGQTSIAATGKSITVYGMRRNISVLR